MAQVGGASSKAWRRFGWLMAGYAWLSYIGMRLMGYAEEKSNVNVTWTDMMNKFNDFAPRFAVCIKNMDYPASLELYKIYRILPDDEAAKDEDVRVIDESGEDYLYPADYFVVIDVPKAVEQAILGQS
jgi:hypothetical protein